MTGFIERLAAGLQNFLPQKTLTALVYRLMRSEVRWLKNLLIRFISAIAGVDWSEARFENPGSYASFNAFFTRELKSGARPADPDPNALLCPCDGRISELGVLRESRLLQAKDVTYSLDALLANDPVCGKLRNGRFFTIYLSPRDYHRVHMPLGGTLQRMIHVPGRLFSVAPYTVRNIPGLFARNERVISVFESPRGPFAQVLVGAMLVASMQTVWAGEVTPSRAREHTSFDYAGERIFLDRGREMGRFNMGSTVILVLPPGMASPDPQLQAGGKVRLGQRLAVLSTIPAG
jgi:phosphatidylserine decarboxylase